MASILAISALALAGSTYAAPTIITGTALPPTTIQVAGGVPLTPGTISQNAIGDFQVANFLENLESNFFQVGLANLTAWGTAGYTGNVNNLATVAKCAAQEEVHVASIETLLQQNGGQTINPCQYSFPVSNAEEFFALANIITSVGIGAIFDLQDGVSKTDPGLEVQVAGIVTVESRHDAFFRMTAGEVPNPTPFDTRISAAWAYNLALDFVIPGSCGSGLPSSITSLPVFPPLGLIGTNEPAFASTNSIGTLVFTVNTNQLPSAWNSKPLFIGWVNQELPVIYTPVTIINGNQLQTQVPTGLNGMAFAALTSQNTAPDVASLTAATIAGPLPIPIS